jgi:hypothetical protein
VFDLRPDDIYWCTADVGWVTGHSYLVYGPLSNGATCFMFEGAPNWGHPLTMCNVVPQANTVAIIAGMLAQVYSLNILEGETAWNVHRAELETAGMLADAFGWDAQKAGCVYTYGGSGCWTYGVNTRSRACRLAQHRNPHGRQDHLLAERTTRCRTAPTDGPRHEQHRQGPHGCDTNAMDLSTGIDPQGLFEGRDASGGCVLRWGRLTPTPLIGGQGSRLLDRHPNPNPWEAAHCDAVVGWSGAVSATTSPTTRLIFERCAAVSPARRGAGVAIATLMRRRRLSQGCGRRSRAARSSTRTRMN